MYNRSRLEGGGDRENMATPDYCVVCMTCANVCPFGAVYAWRVH
ncbi:MAG: 4Fe-4S binding protein [Candidatus Korarchaeota archaeon]|nr:4Fe-4S binding protein [Candidatus Korarchaeota archaeon]